MDELETMTLKGLEKGAVELVRGGLAIGLTLTEIVRVVKEQGYELAYKSSKNHQTAARWLGVCSTSVHKYFKRTKVKTGITRVFKK